MTPSNAGARTLVAGGDWNADVYEANGGKLSWNGNGRPTQAQFVGALATSATSKHIDHPGTCLMVGQCARPPGHHQRPPSPWWMSAVQPSEPSVFSGGFTQADRAAIWLVDGAELVSIGIEMGQSGPRRYLRWMWADACKAITCWMLNHIWGFCVQECVQKHLQYSSQMPLSLYIYIYMILLCMLFQYEVVAYIVRED